MPTELVIVLGVLSLPFVVLGVVTACVMASTWFAHYSGRGAPMDTYQERVFLRRTVTIVQRVHGLGVEGFWQTIAWGLQGVHIVRRFTNPPLTKAGGPPLILVAGYMENGGNMWFLARRLRQRGYQVEVFDLPSTLQGIADNAQALKAEVHRVLEATGAERVALVGHSMGGVVMRACVHGEDPPPVAAVISICSPHRGTRIARWGPGQSARDMRPGSEHMRAHPASSRKGVTIHTVISVQDNIVSPPWSTVLLEGDNVLLDLPVGHTAPLFMREVEAQVFDWLEAADFVPAEPAASTT